MPNPKTYRSLFTKYMLYLHIVWTLFLSVGYGMVLLLDDDPKSDGIYFANPMFGIGLGIHVALILLAYVWVRRYEKLVSYFGTLSKKSFLQPISMPYFVLKTGLLILFFDSIILTLSNPQMGNEKALAYQNNTEIVIALDVSNSMNVRDINSDESRLEIAKRALMDFVNQNTGEKMGICVFAGSAYVQLPLTADYHTVKLFLESIETDVISNQGTNIKQALMTSSKMFSKGKLTKAILLITDGENHEENPDEAYELLKENEIQLAILGLGTESGGTIPIHPKRLELGSKTDASGQTIISKINPSFIKEIATQTGSFAQISNSAFPDLKYVLQHIQVLKSNTETSISSHSKKQIYSIPLSLGILILFALIMLPFFKSKFHV